VEDFLPELGSEHEQVARSEALDHGPEEAPALFFLEFAVGDDLPVEDVADRVDKLVDRQGSE